MTSEGGRHGFSLVEILVVLVLGGLVLAAAWSLVVYQLGLAREVETLGDRLDLTRTIRVVLGREIRAGREGRDWRTFPGDSLTLRAFRGLAFPCGPVREGEVPVDVRAARRPDPVKDSVLHLGPDGRWRVADLASVRPMDGDVASLGRCEPGLPGGKRLEWWTAPGLGDDFVVARIFERGSYHLADGALRYRRGQGGRQPLTVTLLDGVRTRLDESPEHPGLQTRLGFRTLDGGRPDSTEMLTIRAPPP